MIISSLNLLLKFMIVTTELQRIRKLKHGDELIRDVWGAIEYKGEGVFIGWCRCYTIYCNISEVTTDDQIANNKLIFTNKTEKIILKRI
jgi:hypothetical protein